jgi:hypothetical protein
VIRRFLPILCPGLLLVCCDKPGESSTRKGDNEPARRVARSPRSPRENPPDALAELRVTLKAAEKIEAPEAREKALADVAWNALEIDPELARDAFLQLSADNPEKIRLIQHYAMRLAEQDPDEALTWAATLGSEKEIAAANGQIALVLAESDPQRAANLLSESGIVGREFEVAVVQVLQRWAAASPPDAAAWAISFPPGAARAAGINIIVAQWAKTDAQATLAWMSALQDETVRKEVALAMEEALLQQPQDIRDAWLQHADTRTRSELEQQREQAMKEVGDNVPPPPTSNGNAGIHPPDAASPRKP